MTAMRNDGLMRESGGSADMLDAFSYLEARPGSGNSEARGFGCILAVSIRRAIMMSSKICM